MIITPQHVGDHHRCAAVQRINATLNGHPVEAEECLRPDYRRLTVRLSRRRWAHVIYEIRGDRVRHLQFVTRSNPFPTVSQRIRP